MANISAASIIAKYLSELLGQKIDVIAVFDEMFLIEHGKCGKDKMLNRYVKKTMEDYMTKK